MTGANRFLFAGSVPRDFLSRILAAFLVSLAAAPVFLTAQKWDYSVSWLGIKVVDVAIQISLIDGGTQGVYTAQTLPWFNRLYAVDNSYQVLLDTATSRPMEYEKTIIERGRRESLSVRYNYDPPRAVYSNGLERKLPPRAHNLFSALMWVQQRDWTAGEKATIPVEVEGVIWNVEIECTNGKKAKAPEPELKILDIVFTERIRGEPVLSSTDILTYMLPGEGHAMRMALDPETDQVHWITFGVLPFMVQADLISGPAGVE